MKKIKLTQGYYTKVDDEDYEWLNKYKWHVHILTHNLIYVYNNGFYFGLNHRVSMHRLILGLTDSKIHTDHIDGDSLNNQRSNLRVCTRSQNMRNTKSSINSSSKYLGVTLNRNRWSAQICHNRKVYYLGRFKNEFRAAIERDKAAIILHGEFANLNILKVKK